MDQTPKVRGISGLGDLVAAAQMRADLPVESWNPPHCGDIGMKIRADGQWIYGASPIARVRLVKLFSRILRRDADLRYYLVTPVEKIDISVEDAPFLAVELDVSGSGRDQVLTFRTNVDDIVVLSRDNPLFCKFEDNTGGLKPYIRVRGRLDALVTRALCYDLADLAVAFDTSATESAADDLGPAPGSGPDTTTPVGLWSNGAWFALAVQ